MYEVGFVTFTLHAIYFQSGIATNHVNFTPYKIY